MSYTREKFIKLSTLDLCSIPLLSMKSELILEQSLKIAMLKIYLFSKHLQFLDYEEMGFDGIDLTVRPKGHVLPLNVEKDLPKATNAANKVGLNLV